MMRIKYLMVLAIAFATSASAQIIVPFGAPNGSAGQSVNFSGGIGHLDLMIPTENLTTYSMSFWLSPDGIPGENFFMGQTNQGLHLGLRNGGKLHQAHWGSDHSGTSTVPTGAPFEADSWVHAFYSYDAATSQAKIYYNGLNDDGGGVTKNAPNTSGPENFLILGSRNGGQAGFDGQIDDVAFWDTVVSDADIAAIADGTLPTAISTPAQLYFDFEEPNLIHDAGFSRHIANGTGAGIWDVPADHSFIIPAPPFPGEIAEPLEPGNWHARIIDLDTTGTDGQVNTTTEARQILAFADGGPNLNDWTILSDVSDTRNRIDMAGNGGFKFPHNHPYPDGVNDASKSDFVVHATTTQPFSFPEGTYALAFGSDDGGEIILTDGDGNPVNFNVGTQTNVDGDVADGDNIITYNSVRGNAVTCAEFSIPAGGLDINVDAIMFERGGGDSFDISVSDGIGIDGGFGSPDGICDRPLNGRFVTLAGENEFGITLITIGEPACELDGDGQCDHADIDLLYEGGGDEAAIAEWLLSASAPGNPAKLNSDDVYILGDANLDGDVNSTDLGLLLNNFNKSKGDVPAAGTWGGGDLNNSGNVDSIDLGLLINNFGSTSAANVTVPEPNARILLAIGMLAFMTGRRRRQYKPEAQASGFSTRKKTNHSLARRACIFVVALATATSGQVIVPNGAPGGTSGQSLYLRGGVAHANMMIPTENLTSYSMSFWLLPGEACPSNSSRYFLGQSSQGIQLGIGDDERLQQAHWGSDHSGNSVVPEGDPTQAASWTHAFYTFDFTTSEAEIYFNGVNDDGGGVTKNPPNMFGPENFLILGGRNGGGRDGFNGQIDDVAFWDHVVSDADVAAIANGTLPTDIADPAQLYFDFEAENVDNSGHSAEIFSLATGPGIWDVPSNHSFFATRGPPPGEDCQRFAPGSGNWNARMINLDTDGADGQVNSTSEARAILDFANGGPNINNWTIASDVSDTRSRIDMAGNGGVAFPHNHPYPNGVNDTSQTDFVVHASTEKPISFSEGTFAIAFGSDDGGEMILTDGDGNPVNFTSEFHNSSKQRGNGDLDPDDNVLTWDAPRGGNTSCGEISVPAGGLDIHVDAIMFERGGGDSFEIGVSDGPCRSMQNGFFYTLGGIAADGAIGLSTPGNNAPPPDPACDFDGDGGCGQSDINRLYASGADAAAIAAWLAEASSVDNPAKMEAADTFVLGDANLDGDVTSADLGLLLNNFNHSESDVAAAGTWRGGDLNNSGNVDSDDLGLLLNNFGATSSATVPEPRGFILLGLGMLGLLAKRYTRR